jgi:DNA-directed RNA polymerase specialized sigma24 family protein
MGEQNEAPNVASQFGQPATVTLRFDDPFDHHTLRTMLAAASHHARRVARTMRLSDSEREDVEQDILLVVLERHRFFDPGRGAWSSFADRVARQAAQTAADRISAERRRYGASLDHSEGSDDGVIERNVAVDSQAPVGSGSEHEPWLAFMLSRFAAELPDELALTLQLALEENGDLAEAQRRSGWSSAKFYRRLREVRYRLACLGADLKRKRSAAARPDLVRKIQGTLQRGWK